VRVACSVARDVTRPEAGRGGWENFFWETMGVHGEFDGEIAVEVWPE
jgi:hypothetical protein